MTDNDLIGSITTDLQRTFKQELKQFVSQHKKELSIIGFIINIMIGIYAFLEQYDLVGIGIGIGTVSVLFIIVIIYLVMRKKNLSILSDLIQYAGKHRADVDRLLTEVDDILRRCDEKDGIIKEMHQEMEILKTNNMVVQRNINDLSNYLVQSKGENIRLRELVESRGGPKPE